MSKLLEEELMDVDPAMLTAIERHLRARYILVERDPNIDHVKLERDAANNAIMEVICQEICHHFSISMQEFKRGTRGGVAFIAYTYPHIRGMFAVLCKDRDVQARNISYEAMGLFMSKNHATMVHAHRVCSYMMESQKTAYERLMKADYEKIKEKVIQKLKEA